jgi:phage repressor protein C with HTH and peptisase S24 domain
MSIKKYLRFKDYSDIGRRIKEIRANLGLNQTAFAELFGVSQNTVSQWEKGKTLSDEETLRKIAEFAGKSFDWLIKGEEIQRQEASAKFALKDPVMIPLLESRVTAGPQGEILYEKTGERYPFKKWWIEKLVGKNAGRQKDLMLVQVQGDSMTPTINPGELAMVDFGEPERINIKPGRIYLITQPDGGTSIKKVVLGHSEEGLKLICISDNPAYQPFEIKLAPDRRLKRYILGRVRWVGKEFE